MASIPRQGSLPLLCILRSVRPSSSTYRISQRNFSSTHIALAFVNSNARSANSTSNSTRSNNASKPTTPLDHPVRPRSLPAKEPLTPTARNTLAESASQSARSERSLTDGLSDIPPTPSSSTPSSHIDWTRSYHGLGGSAFTSEQGEILTAPLDLDDIEVKPDGILYLPEIKYRRILNRAFGPGGWGLAPRGESIVTGRLVTREYGLVAQGRLISIARGEQQYFDPDGIPTATEGCKSNALMRCCKDIGIASELWDPRFIRKFVAEKTKEVWVEHVVNKKKKKIVLRKDDQVRYPFRESKMGA